MATNAHGLLCYTCGQTLAAGHKVHYFAQCATEIEPTNMVRNVLEEVDFLLDYLKPTCVTVSQLGESDFLNQQDLGHLGGLQEELCEEAKRRLRWVIDVMDARDREAREAASARHADAGKGE